MEAKILTRKELYELVWNKSITQLAKEFSVSVHGLRRVCTKANIPIPPNGHWSKIKFGKPTVKTRLPKDYEGTNEINLADIEGINNPDSQASQLKKKAKTIKEQDNSIFKVPERLTNPDKLIIDTRNYTEAIKRWDYRSNKPRPDSSNTLRIDVSDELLPRAYRLLDTFIKIIRARNHEIRFSYHGSVAVVYDTEIEFRLRERAKVSSEKNSWGGRMLELTGKFVLIIGRWWTREFQDGRETLEEKLPSIIAYIEDLGFKEQQRRIAAEIERKAKEEQKQKEHERKEAKDRESKKFKQVYLDAIRLHQVNIMREYIQKVVSSNQELTSELKDWVEWAIKKVDWYDPFVNGDDPLLGDEEKMIIFKDLK